jgi:hypothetical protein
MCDPLTIAATATVVSTAASVGGQIVQHNEQKKASDANKKNALAAFVENVRALNVRGLQEKAAASDSIEQATTQSQQDAGMAKVSAASAGLAGNSVDAQGQVIDRGLSTFRDSTLQNLDRVLSQLDLEKKGAATAADSRINQMPQPSALGTALGVAGTVANGVTDLYVRRKPTPGKTT